MQRKTLICLTVTVLVYLVTGGAIFHYLEDLHRTSEFVPQANKTAILNLTQEFKEKYAGIEDTDINEFITKVITAYENGEIKKTELDKYKQLYTWDMFNSFYFACSIITTIGYGHITPATVSGMAFTIIYAFIGIPISMLMLAGMGDKLSRSTKIIEDKMLKRTGNPRLAFATRFILIFVGGKIFFMLLPAVIFMYTEGWDLGQGFYYSLITLSTIGLGDRVAGTTTTRLGNHWTEVYRITLILWIYFGMAWVSMCINFIKDWLERSLDNTTNKISDRSEDNSAVIEDTNYVNETQETDDENDVCVVVPCENHV